MVSSRPRLSSPIPRPITSTSTTGPLQAGPKRAPTGGLAKATARGIIAGSAAGTGALAICCQARAQGATATHWMATTITE